MNKQQIKLFGSKASDEWETPQHIYDQLDKELSFDLDVCAAAGNFKHTNYYTLLDDALSKPWTGSVWCNPPYSDVKGFLRKAHEELNNGNCKTLAFLTFSNTDTAWFHDYVLGKAELRFVRGRLKFRGYNSKGVFVNNSAMRPSMVSIFRGTNFFHGSM